MKARVAFIRPQGNRLRIPVRGRLSQLVSLVISRFEWHRVVAGYSSSIPRPASLPNLCSCTARSPTLSLPPSPVYRTYPFPVHVAVQPTVPISQYRRRPSSPASFLIPCRHTRSSPPPAPRERGGKTLFL
jgi:hypothetical protein